MSDTLADHQYQRALAAIDTTDASVVDKLSMLVEVAMELQRRPRSAGQLANAVDLYERALALCPASEYLVAARIRVHLATALLAMPASGGIPLQHARNELEQALPVLASSGGPEESAAAEMNLGLVIQSLAGLGQARISEAIACYQRALRVFTGAIHPVEFAILHNNLATAFLSIPATDERARMREALAVQAFEAALSVVSLVDYPTEYAMLQNNLGNALQYSNTAHPVENNLRALQAYEEALKVRNRRDTPLAYANTTSNKANCLCNLPDDPHHPELGNRSRLQEAKGLYEEARALFVEFGEAYKVPPVDEALAAIHASLGNGSRGNRSGDAGSRFGESRV